MIAGDKVVYPCQGPCLINSVVLKSVADSPKSFYHLVILVDDGGELFVPVDKAQSIGLRLLLKRSEIPELLNCLMMTSKITQDRRRRPQEILELFSSGSAFDLAEIVKLLTEMSQTRALSFRESRTLERAKKFLVCEISEVLEETRSAAEARVDQALSGGKIVDVNKHSNGLPSPEPGEGQPEDADS
ncbi:MAG TPA: CarD family transcriptional regulator [Blastocatellia bacterium]|nr:CarD family transcriptional regulator [Blastocatellia bacterium]